MNGFVDFPVMCVCVCVCVWLLTVTVWGVLGYAWIDSIGETSIDGCMRRRWSKRNMLTHINNNESDNDYA